MGVQAEGEELLKKESLRALGEEGKAGFVQKHRDSGVLQEGREIGLNSRYKEKWAFTAKEKGGAQWMEDLLGGNVRSREDFG